MGTYLWVWYCRPSENYIYVECLCRVILQWSLLNRLFFVILKIGNGASLTRVKKAFVLTKWCKSNIIAAWNEISLVSMSSKKLKNKTFYYLLLHCQLLLPSTKSKFKSSSFRRWHLFKLENVTSYTSEDNARLTTGYL